MTVPILQSLLLADHVYRDQMTGKHIICGVFSTIYFTPNPPSPSPTADPLSTPKIHESGAPASPGIATGRGNGANGGTTEVSSPSGSSDPTFADKPHAAGRQGENHPQHQRQQPIQHLMQAGSPYVYFSVTELSGRKMFEVRYVELKENRILFQTELPIECNDPLLTIEVTLPLPRLPLVGWEEQSYGLEVVCEGQLLGTYRVLARITPGSTPATNN